VGVSSPFAPGSLLPLPQGGHLSPGFSFDDIRSLRTMIRLVAPPARAPIVPGSSEERGRILFGVDYTQPFGLAKDRKANCVSCHVPYMVTGRSPAEVGGSHLSNKRVYLFSDLLIHDMGQADSDNALPSQGRANGRMWRTTPLMGIGLIGPPFFHDGRVDAATIDEALDLSIDAHDNNGMDVDSEAHASTEFYRNLPADGVNSQRDIVNFMKTL
jgi:cytochrome c peroxidase